MKLIKSSNDWQDWRLELNETIFDLKGGSRYDDNIYELPYHHESDVFKQISNLPICSIPSEIRIPLDGQKFHHMATFASINGQDDSIEVCWTIDPLSWNGTINPKLLRDEMVQASKSLNSSAVLINTEDNDGYLDIFFSFNFQPKITISEAAETINKHIDELQNKASDNIQTLDSTDKIIARFNFSTGVETSCTRYLVYFIEFLRDLGIDSNSTVTRRGHETLFSIEPTDKDTSLRTIKEALVIYLSLPELEPPLASNHQEPIIQLKLEKLISEVTNIKSENRVQAALLSLQTEKITNLSQELAKIKTPRNSLVSVSSDNKTQSSDMFFGGFIKLGRFQYLGIELDWSSLKRRLSKNSNDPR
ncbi:hypothetical protein D7241_03170 [Stutzerimonas sp. VN223-3]|uniref:hypothetical protein n=1 Tax=Stutzerimonas sp. VN223-3 TaxID=3384601 RepID=UPI0038B5D6C0